MKTWLPFSDYDFYSYICSGVILLFAIDYWLSNGAHAADASWTAQQGVLVAIIAYITGQIISIPASILYESLLIEKILGHPMEMQLGKGKSRLIDKFLKLINNRDYGALPESIKKNLMQRAKNDTKLKEDTLLDDKKNIFDIAFTASRLRKEDKERIDDYRNQYGFSRNMSLSSFITAGFTYYSDDVNAQILAAVFCFLGFGMMLRFITFYSSFSAEVFRSYAFEDKTTTLEVIANKAAD